MLSFVDSYSFSCYHQLCESFMTLGPTKAMPIRRKYHLMSTNYRDKFISSINGIKSGLQRRLYFSRYTANTGTNSKGSPVYWVWAESLVHLVELQVHMVGGGLLAHKVETRLQVHRVRTEYLVY